MDSQASALAERVRDLVRERRIDPRTDADSVRRAALDVIAEHESRSRTGAVGSLDGPDRVVGHIVADVSGFGPLQPYLDDQTVDYAGGVIRFEIEEDVRHRLLGGHDEISITCLLYTSPSPRDS